MSDHKFPPTGGTKRFLITMNKEPWASFDTKEQAQKYVDMQRNNLAGNAAAKGTFASKQNWDITDRNA